MSENRRAQASEPEAVITVEHLEKSFDARPVLVDINMNLYRGENLIILGQSGMGKSVLIKCIVGLIRVERGVITILGDNIVQLKSKALERVRRKVGFSFQGSALYDSMSVTENLEFPLRRNMGLSNRKVLAEKVAEALEDVGLFNAKDKMPAELSGGMRKRIGIARTLILEPEIMLYDEPTAGLDPYTCMEINNLILEVQQKHHTSAIIITHDITCARTTGNRMIYLKDGRILQQGSWEELDQHPVEQHLKVFFDYYKH